MFEFQIKPEWRTATVLGLCRSMRETGEYSAMPILADALQDADCTSHELLKFLRNPSPDHYSNVSVVALVMLPEARDAIDWIEAFAEGIADPYADDDEETDWRDCVVDYSEVMRAAGASLDRSDPYSICLPFDTPEDLYAGSEKMTKLWECFRTLTGRAVTADQEEGLFRCAC